MLRRSLSRPPHSALWSLLAALALPLTAAAQETLCPCPPPPPPPPLWTGSFAFSYLATTGNSETETLGFALAWSRQPTPWGLEINASANRAESDGVKTAERLFGSLRGKRQLADRFDLFAGLSHEHNELAGFDARSVLEAGAAYRALTGPAHELTFDAGLTWTQEDFVDGTDDDAFGALAGLAYTWNISAGAKLTERFLIFPNFDQSDDWRLSSETALEAALATSWALRVSYLYQRDNLPPPGFEETDTSTAVSTVWKR
jgi:putative salt-induced outer membrane protein